MNRSAYKLILLVIIAAMWASAFAVQRRLNADRTRLGLTRVTPLENAPPMLAFTTVALGGFRGLIANALWIRAMDLQESGKYFELIQLADWITKLQPHNALAWRTHASNLGYNISRNFPDPRERWLWVQRGIELLRDEALRYNPSESQIYHELAWHFQHKIGYNLDDAHVYYKTQLAHEMIRLLGGGRPDYAALIDPQTDEQRARAAELRGKWKLDPQLMREVDNRYAPLDWRMPESHAIYWAHAGLKNCGKGGALKLRRVLWQSMQAMVLRGRLIPNVAEKRFEWGPNLDLLPATVALFEQLQAEAPEERDAMAAGHSSFLRETVYLLYLNNRVGEAAAYLAKFRELYPDMPPAADTVDEFVLQMLNARLEGAGVDRTRVTIDGLLHQAYYRLALGDTDAAAGLERLAALAHQRHQTKFATQLERVGMPPLQEMRGQVLAQMLGPESQLAAQMQAQLRTALNLPAATNAPPASRK